MNKNNAKKVRLELDTEVIADLEVDGADVKGGILGGASSSGGNPSASIVVSKRGGAVASDGPVAYGGC